MWCKYDHFVLACRTGVGGLEEEEEEDYICSSRQGLI